MLRTSFPSYDLSHLTTQLQQIPLYKSPSKSDYNQTNFRFFEEIDTVLSKLNDLVIYFNTLKLTISTKFKDPKSRFSVPAIVEETFLMSEQESNHFDDQTFVDGVQSDQLDHHIARLKETLTEFQNIFNTPKSTELGPTWSSPKFQGIPKIQPELNKLTSFGSISEILFDSQQTFLISDKPQNYRFPLLERASSVQEPVLQKSGSMLLKDISPINAMNETVVKKVHNFGDTLRMVKGGQIYSDPLSKSVVTINESVNTFCSPSRKTVTPRELTPRELDQEEQDTICQDFSFELKQGPLKLHRFSTEGSVVKENEVILAEMDRQKKESP